MKLWSDHMEPSQDALHNHINTSSPTVRYIQVEHGPQTGQRVLQVRHGSFDADAT